MVKSVENVEVVPDVVENYLDFIRDDWFNFDYTNPVNNLMYIGQDLIHNTSANREVADWVFGENNEEKLLSALRNGYISESDNECIDLILGMFRKDALNGNYTTYK